MIKSGTENLINWLDLNALIEWNIATSRDKQQNNFIFKSNPETSRENEISRMRDVLAISDNQLLYVNGKNKAGNTGNFSDTWQNLSGVTQPGASIGSTQPIMDQDYIETKIAAALERNNLDWKLKQYEQDLKDFKDEKREYESERNGIVGILVEKAAPLLGGFLQKMNPSMAGLDDQNFKAKRIKPIQVVDDLQEEELEEVFSEEESDELFTLVERWKKVDPEYIQLLEKFVTFAESNDPIKVVGMKFSYQQIKDLLLNS